MSSSYTRVIELRFYLCVHEFQKKHKIFHTFDKNMKTHQMPNDTSFLSKWLQKIDSTDKPCSIRLRQGDFFNKYCFLHMQKSLQSTYACRGNKHSPSIIDKKEGKEGFL
jgi:hypothetical protein